MCDLCGFFSSVALCDKTVDGVLERTDVFVCQSCYYDGIATLDDNIMYSRTTPFD